MMFVCYRLAPLTTLLLLCLLCGPGQAQNAPQPAEQTPAVRTGPPKPSNPLTSLVGEVGEPKRALKNPSSQKLMDYRTVPDRQRTVKQPKPLKPFGYRFFDAPRQVIDARRAALTPHSTPFGGTGASARRAAGTGTTGQGHNRQGRGAGNRKTDQTDPDDPEHKRTDTDGSDDHSRAQDTDKDNRAQDTDTDDRTRGANRANRTRQDDPAQRSDATGGRDDTTTADTDRESGDTDSRRKSPTTEDEDADNARDRQPSEAGDRQQSGTRDRQPSEADERQQSGTGERRAATERRPATRDRTDQEETDTEVTPRAQNAKSLDPPTPTIDSYRQVSDPLSQLYANVSATAPTNYQLETGDTFSLRYGSPTLEAREVSLTVDPTGGITLPEVGRITVRGQSPTQAEAALQQRMQDYYPGVKVTLTLHDLRTIAVTLSGEAYLPGTYVVPAVTTAYNLIYATGGPSESGTLRGIELRRSGRVVAVIDFYRLLITGQNVADMRLQSGDILYIPARMAQVAVRGEVRRQALYEVLDTETLQDALHYAGGLLPTGVRQRVQVGTISPAGEHMLRDVDLSVTDAANHVPIFDGDSIEVFSARDTLANKVTVEGAVDQPGDYALETSMTLGDLVRRSRGLLPEAYSARADLHRVNPDLSLTLIPVNLERVLAGDPTANLALQRWDRLTIYTSAQMTWQAQRDVTVRGAVSKPGIYYRADNMRVRDLLLEAAGPLPDAAQVVLLHHHPDGSYTYAYPELTRVLQEDPKDNLPLENGDTLAVYHANEARFTTDHIVTVQGEVVTPSIYPRGEGMRLSDALHVAGGLTPRADGTIEIAAAHTLLGSRATKAVYVAETGKVTPDPILTDGDVVMIRARGSYQDHPSVVWVKGAVNRPGPIALRDGKMRLSDAIREAGGLQADGYAEGAEFTRYPSHLVSTEQTQIATVISKLNSLINSAEYRRELARSDVERLKMASSTHTDSSLPVSIPGLTPAAAPTPIDPAALRNGTDNLFSRELVSMPRNLSAADLQPQGNVSIDLAGALRRPGSIDDITLLDGDTVTVPTVPTTVQVVGAVVQSRAVPYRPNAGIAYYVDQCGGYAPDAALDRAIVIRGGGGIIPAKKVGALRPGDVIMFPTRVMADRLKANTNQISEIFKGITNSALVLLVANKLIGF